MTCQIGQTTSGRWWVQCARPACTYYGVAADQPTAEAMARAHERQHRSTK